MTDTPARPPRAATLRGMAWLAAAGLLFCLLNTIARRLAQELDQSEFRANRLEEVNREVSRRLVTAMETIRAVLDR